MAKVDVKDLNVWFGSKHVLKDLALKISASRVTSVMGPSGCGKSTFIKSLNRMNEIAEGCKTTGEVYIDGENIYDINTDIYEIRRRVGMVFQKPNPFPKSIFDNVAYGLRLRGIKDNSRLKGIVEESLKEAVLWDEVYDRLDESALSLSGGQQQRLCIARTLAVKPEIVLMDEPCSALDPAATAKIEDLMRRLKEHYTVIVVTHNMQQAARVSDMTAFLYLGEIIEYGPTAQVFENPISELTEKFITGKFG